MTGHVKEQIDGESIGLPSAIPLSLVFLLIAILLSLIYSLPLKDTLVWYAGVFLYLFIPGNLLLRCVSSGEREYLSNFFHSLALGTALMPLIYSVLRRFQHPEHMYLLGVTLTVIWLMASIRDFKGRKIGQHISRKDLPPVLILLVYVLLLLHFSYFTDIVLLKDGFRIRISDLTEADFHLGIINNLRHMYPPLLPYATGISASNYHLNMHLEIEMFNRIFSLDTKELTYFYFPFLYFSLLVFVPYIFIRRFWGGRFLGVFTGILVFSSDLSFIPGIMGGLNLDFPWTAFFKSTIWSLFSLNGNVPALFILFLSFLYLKRFFDDGRISYLSIFCLLVYSSFGFKSSMGAHITGVTFLTGIFIILLMKDRNRGLILCGISALTALAMAVDLIFLRKETGNLIFTIDLLNGLHLSMKLLNGYGVRIKSLPLSIIAYIVGTLGIRILGFYTIKEVFTKKKDPLILFLLIFVISGLLFSEIFYLGPEEKWLLNEANWFANQSLMGALFLLSYFLKSVNLPRKWFSTLIIVLILFSFPSTIQFLSIRFDSHYYTYDHNAVEVIKYLEQTPPDSVIMHPPNIGRPSLSANFAGRQSIYSYYHSFISRIKGKGEAKKRLEDLALFFRSGDLKNMPYILKKYKVNYVYAPLDYASRLDREPLLEQVLKNDAYVVYKVLF